jgi:hypothetical protein
MKLPWQAPSVVREAYSWSARSHGQAPNGLLPANICCGTGKACSDGTHEWCCAANQTCGSYTGTKCQAGLV